MDRPAQCGARRSDAHLHYRCRRPSDTCAEIEPLGDRCDLAGKAVVQPPLPAQLQADHALRRDQPDPRILHIGGDRRQRERLAGWRGHELVEHAERQLAVDQPGVHPDMAGADRGYGGAGQADARAQLDPVSDEIGMGRIADRHIGQPLAIEAEIGDPVARRHAVAGERLVDIAGSDRLALRPQHEQADEQHQRHCEHDVARPPPVRLVLNRFVQTHAARHSRLRHPLRQHSSIGPAQARAIARGQPPH